MKTGKTLLIVGAAGVAVFVLYKIFGTPQGLPCEAYGDVDFDGEVTENDFNMIADHIMKINLLTGEALQRANVKGFGEVDASDLQLVRQYLDHTIDIFPVCG